VLEPTNDVLNINRGDIELFPIVQYTQNLGACRPQRPRAVPVHEAFVSSPCPMIYELFAGCIHISKYSIVRCHTHVNARFVSVLCGRILAEMDGANEEPAAVQVTAGGSQKLPKGRQKWLKMSRNEQSPCPIRCRYSAIYPCDIGI
jgi:hypothetical protein